MTPYLGILAIKAMLQVPGPYRGPAVAPLFAAVIGPDPADIAAAVKVYPRCELSLVELAIEDIWDPGTPVSTVTYEAVITILAAATSNPQDELDLIIAATRILLTGSSVGVGGLPEMTAVQSVKYQKFGSGLSKLEANASPLERRAWLYGGFAYQ